MTFSLQFQDFLNHIKITDLIETAKLTNTNYIHIDLTKLMNFNIKLYEKLINEYITYKNEITNLIPITTRYTNNTFIHQLTDLKSNRLNKLSTFIATVTRTSSVNLEPLSFNFICLECRCQTTAETISKCINPLCNNRTRFELGQSCVFVDCQKINVQEGQRNFTIKLKNDHVERVKPGDKVRFTGELFVKDMQYVFEVNNLEIMNDLSEVLENYEEINKENFNANDLNKENIQHNINDNINKGDSNKNDTINNNNIAHNTKNDDSLTSLPFNIYKIAQTSNLYEKLANSLFPSIQGNDCIKKALLLMMAQGTHKEGIRSDINVLLVGDPGTAKSQFLKRVSQVSNGIYTSGKSSSRAGLTAAVVRDGNDFTVEAGALMLADKNICCIDEFDKMNIHDRVGIHEAMEQQTITINKAGINTTLNARASVLAAANSKFGKYDENRTLKANLNLSEAVFSRFDLYFISTDKVSEERDGKIAKRILDNHVRWNYEATKNDLIRTGDNLEENHQFTENENYQYFTDNEIKNYLEYIKTHIKPIIPPEINDIIISRYIELRQNCFANSTNYRVTVRQLESIIRLSEALAKIHCNKKVTKNYVDEAYSLIASSITELTEENINFELSNIDINDYRKIMNNLIYILKNNTELTKETLIENYILQKENEIKNEGEYMEEIKKVEDVIGRMVEKENVLYESGGVIYIHPNYDV